MIFVIVFLLVLYFFAVWSGSMHWATGRWGCSGRIALLMLVAFLVVLGMSMR